MKYRFLVLRISIMLHVVLLALFLQQHRQYQQLRKMLEEGIQRIGDEVRDQSDHSDALTDYVLERIAEVREVQIRMEQANMKGLGIFRFNDPGYDPDK